MKDYVTLNTGVMDAENLISQLQKYFVRMSHSSSHIINKKCWFGDPKRRL